MFSLISFLFHHWLILLVIAGGGIAASWYYSLIQIPHTVWKAVEFAKTKAGIGVIALGLGLTIGWMAHNNDIVIERLNSEKAALERDRDIAETMQRSAGEAAAKLEKDADENGHKIAKLESDLTEIRNRPAPAPKVIVKTKTQTKIVHDMTSCPASDEDIRRLQEIH